MMAIEFSKLVRHARRRAHGKWWDALCPGHEDQRASLSFTDGDHALVLECHAGCPRERIAAALGRSITDFTHRTKGGPPRGRRREMVAYDYTDVAGTLMYQVVRYEPKDFRQRRPDGAGWTWNMDGVPRVPYRLHELAEARRVYVPEGEKDVDNLRGRPA